MLWVQYLDEHLLAGAVGRAGILIAFLAAILAAYGAYRGTQAERQQQASTGWSHLAGGAFGVMALGIVSIIALLLTMMTQHWYEYQYVQQHVNDELAFKYVFTAFWEGQEGSFLLWLGWHSVLGLVVWFSNRTWRLPVLAVIASVQVVLLSMLLGVYLPIGDGSRIGSSPFLLLREVMDIPIFSQADYVSLIEGTGLNPLLQNYWMLIHPPTLFLGFASTVVPFAFAIAGLWTQRHREWLQPALRWSLFSAGILGIGILMGGAWAYEALNFGGYWAWDPVENTSLVPWLLLIAGIHTNLVARATGHSIKSTYIFYLLCFVGILYSSFLTRSGVLGETSVHAFTEMGLETQLMLLVGIFSLLGVGALAVRWREIPVKAQEEASTSREFWMFLGSLVLLFSAGMITASTSLPVFNKLGDTLGFEFGHLTINEPVAHYNRYQLWVGVFMGLFTSFAHYFRWRARGGHNMRNLLLRMAAGAAVAIGLAVWTGSLLADTGWQFTALAFAAWYTLISNLDYLATSRLSLWQRTGSVAAHAGFGIMLLGILFSGLNQHHISKNTFAMDGLLGEEQIGKNVLLVKGLPMVINGYEVTYLSDTLQGNRRDFDVRYRELSRTGEVGKEFVLRPYALYTNDFAKIASMNPDTRHYWDHDVFTHITGLPPGSQSAEQAQAFEDSLRFERYALRIGESTASSKHRLTLLAVTDTPTHPDYTPEPGDIALGMEVKLERLDFDTAQIARPVVVLRENLVYSYPAQVNAFSARVQIPEDAFAARFTEDAELDYAAAKLSPGQSIQLGDTTFTFEGFDTKAVHRGYEPVEGDVAVNATIRVTAGARSSTLQPLYFIRGNSPRNLKDVNSDLGIHARVVGIDPATGQADVRAAVAAPKLAAALPVEVAENASRSDWLVLEATVFPGINLFWIGTILMLLGLLISMAFRMQEKSASAKTSPLAPQRPVHHPVEAQAALAD